MSSAKGITGLFRAILEAIHGSDDDIAGQRLTRLTAPLLVDDDEIQVHSTIGFGEVKDGTGNAKLVIDGEIITATGRTLKSFTGLERGIDRSDIPSVHNNTSLVYDYAQNTTALDHARRGIFVDTAVGTDLDVIGRNLGVDKCPGLTDDQWREVIKATAYLSKTTHAAFLYALAAIFDENDFFVFERNITNPFTTFVEVAAPLGGDLQGKFFLNRGEPHTTTGDGSVAFAAYDVNTSPFDGGVARGRIQCVSGGFLVDGENLVLSDGVNPAVTFEFDSDASVVETPALRAVAFTATDSPSTVRDALVTAITGAPTLNITAEAGQWSDGDLIADVLTLANTAVGIAGNVTATSTVADVGWVLSGMSGGQDVDPLFGVFGVFLDTQAARLGDRTGQNFYTGGSFTGNEITLGVNPGPGVDLLIDYNASEGHYLPEAPGFVDSNDLAPYLSDNLLQARCLVDQIRAAGFGVELRPRL